MTDDATPAAAPATAPAKPPTAPSRARRIIAVAVAVVVAVGVFLGVQALLRVVNQPNVAPSTIEESTSYSYVSDEYGFSVDFPSEPTETTQVQPVAGYDIELLQVQWVNSDTTYLVGAAIFPPELLEQNLDVMLQNSIGGAASASGAELSDLEFIELAGERAIRGTLTFPNGQVGVTVIALHNGGQYSLTMVSSEADREAFLEGFAFTS